MMSKQFLWLSVFLACVTMPFANGLQIYMYHNGSGQSIAEVHQPCPTGYDVGFYEDLISDPDIPGGRKSTGGLSRGFFSALDPPTKYDEFDELVYWYDVGGAVSLDWKYCVVDRSVCDPLLDRIVLGWNPPEDGGLPGGVPVDPGAFCSWVLG